MPFNQKVSVSGEIAIPDAAPSVPGRPGQDGVMTDAQATKLASLSPGGGVTAVTASPPLASSGGFTPNISLTPPNAIDVSLAADYSNQTNTFTDVVTGTITTSGGDLEVSWDGNVTGGGADNQALIQALTDDFPLASVALYVDGVLVPHTNTDIFSAPVLNSGIWFSSLWGVVSRSVKVTGLAAGAHTVAVKAALTVVPVMGGNISCLAGAGPNIFGFRLQAVEV